MATNESLARVARIHEMARVCIAQKVRMLVGSGQIVGVSLAAADAIIAALAAHDPPLLVCTPDEMKE